MKNILRFKVLHFILILLLGAGQACEGPEGPEGPQGPTGTPGAQGPAGPAGPAGTPATADVYEIGGWNFNAGNEYQEGIGFADNDIEVGEEDIVLVYRLSSVFQNKPVWAPLPQTLFHSQGPFVYSFVHTPDEMAIYLDGGFDLAVLPASLLTNQIFRIVVAPGTIRGGRKIMPSIDYKNYNEVANYYNLTETRVKKIMVK